MAHREVLHMRYSYLFVIGFSLVSTFLPSGCTRTAKPEGPPPPQTVAEEKPVAAAPASDDEFDGREIVKTEAEWKAELTPAQYHILREGGTEPAFKNEYASNHEQ